MTTGRSDRSRPGAGLERVLEACVTASASRPRRTLAWLFFATLLFAGGLTRLRFDTAILDWLPARHENVRAFGRMLERLDGITNQELVWVELDPAKAEAAGVRTVVDEGAVRAQQELVDFVRERVPRIRHAFGLPHWFSLLHRANRGDDPDAYRLPDASFEYPLIWTALDTTNGDLLRPTMSGDLRGTYVGLVVDGNPLTRPAREAGRAIERAIEAYKRAPDLEHDVFRFEVLHPVGLASGTARVDDILRRDVARLLPIAAALVLGSLMLVFRRASVALSGLAGVGVGVVWTYGAMGWVGVPLNVVNVALVPLVFGCGVDYAIHVLNEYGQGRARGRNRLEGLRDAARASGAGIVLTTLTTMAGLLSLVVADVPGMSQLGLFAAFGMLSLAVLSLTLLPALLAASPASDIPAGVPENPWIGRVMGWPARRRGVAALLFVAITAALLFASGRTPVLIDPIQGNFRSDEPVMRAVERMRAEAAGGLPDFLIVEGDLADPRAIETMRFVERTVASSPDLAESLSVATYADILGAHEVLRGGTVRALGALARAGGDPVNAIPEDRERVRTAIADMHEDPGWRPLASLFFDPAGSIGVGIALIEADAFDGVDGARRLYERLEDLGASATVHARDLGLDLRVSFLGYRTMSYLFYSESMKWLRIVFVVSFLVALSLVGVFLRDLRAWVAIGVLMLATGVWWVGSLAVFEIYRSVFLLFPLVFVICIGSDYGLHLAWRLAGGAPPALVWRTTGRAIGFSALTDGLVFAVFVPIGLVSASRVMLAVVLAVACVLVATLLVVPAVFGSRPSSGAARSATGPAAGSGAEVR